jgi:hypothetical protein
MLVIVHNSHASHDGAFWDEGCRDWLFLDQEGLLRQGGADVSGREWRAVLAERLVKSTQTGVTINRLALIVPTLQSSEVQGILAYVLSLAKQDYWVDVGIVTACDVQTEEGVVAETQSVQNLLLSDQCGRLRSIWMLGRITSLKDAIEPALRASAIDYLLKILARGGEDCAFQIGLLPEGDGERRPCQLCAWGFQSFMPDSSEIDSFMGAEFRKCVSSGLGPQYEIDKSLPDLLAQKAAGFLSAGLELDLAFDGQEEGGTKPWRDTVPSPPETPLRTWKCRFLSTGEEVSWLGKGLLLNHEPHIVGYYQALIDFLRKQSSNVRLKGQDRLAHITQDARLFVLEEKRIYRLTAALRHFFPFFRRTSNPPLPTSACPSEHDPSLVTVVKKVIHDVIASSEKRCCDDLITGKTRSYFLLGLCLVAIVSGLLFWRSGGDFRSLIPVALALLVVVIADAWNRRKFNRIKAAVNADIEREQAQLRAEFARKLEWVLEKTGLTVRSQVAADMTALENLIRRKVDFLCGLDLYSDVATVKQLANDEDKVSFNLNLPADVQDHVRDTIEEAGKQIVLLSDEYGEIEWARVLESAKRQIASLMESPDPGPYAALDERLAQCCELEATPFLAQYDGVFNHRPFTKLFLLPRNTPQAWIDSIQTKAHRGDQKVSVYKADFKGASVLVRYNNLRPDQLLICFGFPQRQEGQG